MKIGVVSDLHLLHWMRAYALSDVIGPVIASLKRERPNVLVNAGDAEVPEALRRIAERLGIPLFEVKGNHDFYGTTWHRRPLDDCAFLEIDGVQFIGTTMWMNLNGRTEVAEVVRRELADFHVIEGFTVDVCLAAHYLQLGWLEGKAALYPGAVIVTHHSPTHRSCHPRYGDASVNYGFSSHLDEVVTRARARLWIHGHTHDPYDYMHGRTRIICNPCGYPSERIAVDGIKPYEPVYVEVDTRPGG